ncbi:hypothetical protein FA09DRAFT_331218 [Tilletiopsis washingtonensis]|uniref:Uncharacterized protein n=1 Tax=Tilletiopsis washingtonensis TaxID=58919 RepID=A0A316Z4T2_9BASI|nr:hypothetical protein FA09DRAFT_331218 [Tilletiopsis washingtonensis]PWN96760.1 hypothetical protein FA09DRAFT_331218 [Tilletiopsis washingtonensis]
MPERADAGAVAKFRHACSPRLPSALRLPAARECSYGAQRQSDVSERRLRCAWKCGCVSM